MEVVKAKPVKKTMTLEARSTAGERKAQKRRAVIENVARLSGTHKSSDEPIISNENYTIDLMRALNYYTAAYDAKDKRKWTLDYVGKSNAKLLENVPEYQFLSVGTVIRLKRRNQFLKQTELNYIDTKLGELYALNTALKPTLFEKNTKPAMKVSPLDKFATITSSVIGEFNGMIDEFMLSNVRPDFAGYLKTNSVPAQSLKLIPAPFQKTLVELREAQAGSDAQLVEGYSNFDKHKMKSLIECLENLLEACDQSRSNSKPVKARRAKPASVLASKVKYLPEDSSLGLKSVTPDKIIGATEVILYNTKYKKLQVYRTDPGVVLSIKGTTIIGYSSTSSAKCIRKPETVNGFASMSRATFENFFKSIKTKNSSVNGRINGDCIIVKVL